jgi:Protein of unknown function (DUF3306)
MNDPENFIDRWSRRKQEAASEDAEPKKASSEGAAASRSDEEAKSKSGELEAPVPEFDISSLPPIESISAETDITAFMRTGVPETLKHAALRRVWASDPVIRDFVGLNENFWDAAGPDGIPGFGDLDPNLDVRRMVSELFGETPHQDTQPGSEADRVADSSALATDNSPDAANPPQATLAAGENVPQRNENAAAQTESPEAAPEKKISRRHGGAMPE